MCVSELEVGRDYCDLFLLNPPSSVCLFRENILQIAICSVKTKCNRDGVVNVSFSLSISVSIFLLRYFFFFFSIFAYSSLLVLLRKRKSISTITRKKKMRAEKRSREKRRGRTILPQYCDYSTRISLSDEITICYSYHFDIFNL